MSAGFGRIMQHGYIVSDVEATAQEWAKRVGAGPFYVIDTRMEEYYYRGARTPVELRLAFGYWGSIQIELIQPLGDADTLYSRALKCAPGKINHCATVVSDIDGLLAAGNLQGRVIQSGSMPTGLKFVYLEEYLPDGLHLELIQPVGAALQAFEGMEAVARNWDGVGTLRPATALAQDLASLSLG
jgi:methylmalonyl-CoA/ethylmalonyl-CoA epimerase